MGGESILRAVRALAKRSLSMMEQVNPANLDAELYRKLCAEYGGKFTRGRLEGNLVPSKLEGSGGLHPAERDEWRHCGIETRDDIYNRFVPNFSLV